MNLEDIILNELFQGQENKYCLIFHIRGILKSRVVVSRGGAGETLLGRHKLSYKTRNSGSDTQ